MDKTAGKSRFFQNQKGSFLSFKTISFYLKSGN